MSSNNVIEQKIVDTLESNYMPYAMSVIVSRAIPEIDGLKPSHRKLLYTMYKMGLLTGAKTKSANVVGQTMKLNPHGDMTIYETLVRLTRGNNALLLPYIDSKGNFGKYYSRDMSFAAPRYTEVKLEKMCEELFKDLDKNTVDFVDNYDGTMKEPVLLPITYPNILVNSNQGIAVGMASNICSFNLKEVCEATIAYLGDDDINILNYLKGPDLPSGGQLIYNEKDMQKIYETGRGSFKVRGKYRFDKKNNCIEIFEIPYSTTAEAIIDGVIGLIKNNKIKEITDIRDETDLKGLKIALDIRRNTDPNILMQKLYKFTTLEDNFNCNFNILINGRPKVLGIKGILKEWIIFRIKCIKRQITYDIEKKSDKLHLLLGLEKILLDIDKAIRIVRNTEEDAQVVPNLVKGFEIDKVQAEFVAEIKLRNLNKEYILNRVSEIENLQKDIKELKDTLDDEKKIKKIIVRQLKDVSKRYGKPRNTEIIHEKHVEEITHEHLIEDYNLKVFLTEDNYLKKIALTSLRGNPEQKLKEEDKIIQEVEGRNKSEMLLFSNKCTVYKLRLFEVEDCKASSLGIYLPNLLELEEDEEILCIAITDEYEGYMIFAFESGKVAKISLKNYETKTNRKKLANAYSGASKLVHLFHILEDTELVAFSNINKVLVFNTLNIGVKATRTSQGEQVLRVKKEEWMASVKKLEDTNIKDFNYYRIKNIPAVGYYLKDEDKENIK